MSRNNPGLTLAYLAATAVAARSLVKHGANDGDAALATSPADALLGVTTNVPADVGEHVDVVRSGITPVRYGAAVTRGQPLTADATGAAVPAAAGQQYAGYAEVSGVAGDIGSIHLQRGKLAA